MTDKHLNWNKCKSLFIEDADDYKEKIRTAYEMWEANGFTDEWLAKLKNRWFPCSLVFNFIELLKSKKDLSEAEYQANEVKVIKEFEATKKELKEILIWLEAEQKAFENAGVTEGRVEFKCPHCGNVAIANRYKYKGRYHGLGSGCRSCNFSHT